MTDEAALRVYAVLDDLGIVHERHEHPPVFTVEEAVQHWAGIDATHCKNLFLRNKKGTRHYLVVAEHRKPVDLRRVADLVGDDRLSFGSPERLMKHLGLTPGSVSPFGLLNDPGRSVQVLLDVNLKHSVRVAFHPNINTATVVLSLGDFERFLAWCGHVVRFLEL